ncbi:hypothetical protein Tco_0317969 [Tanacetum coccineum]
MLGRQMVLVGDETEIVPLYYHMFENFQIQFGREEFCLVTGLKFGVEYWADYNDEDEPIPLRRRVFPSSLDGILQLVLLGVEDRRAVPDWILRLANDRDGWDKYPGVRIQEPNDYYTRHRRYPRVAAWSSNKKFYRHILHDFLHGRVPAKRLIPDEIEAGSGWWVSSKAYFGGHVSKAERMPCHLNRQNHYEVPSEFYREFEEQRSGLDKMMKQGQDMYEK